MKSWTVYVDIDGSVMVAVKSVQNSMPVKPHAQYIVHSVYRVNCRGEKKQQACGKHSAKKIKPWVF